jgi:hypothetical protein
MSKLATQQSDLARMKHLVLGAPQQRPLLRLRQPVRFQDRLVQLILVKSAQLRKHLLVDPIEDSTDFDLAGVFTGVGFGHGLPPEQAKEVLGDYFCILRMRPSNAFQSEPVLRHGQVAYLPSNVADAARRMPKPLGCRRPIEKSDRVVAGEDDLLDDKAPSIHDFTPFPAAR